MLLQFPSDVNTSEEAFIMTPYEFNVHISNTKQKVTRNTNKKSIILPTPSGGLSLNESGNWDETEGFLDLASGLAGTFLKKTKEGAGTLGAHVVKGQTINDYASLSYSGSNFRTYTFSWDLIPHSIEEAKELSEIIKTIRQYSLPNISGKTFKYPFMWKVSPCIQTGINLSILDCVISNFSVNYTPEGVLRMFSSGHSTSINMEIEFRELYRASSGDI